MKISSHNLSINSCKQSLIFFALIALLTGFLLPSAALAGNKKDSKEREAQRHILQMQQQMEAEKTALQAEIDKQKQAALTSQKEADALKESLSTNSHRNAALVKELEAVKHQKTDIETKLHDTQAALDTTTTHLDDLNKRYTEAQSLLQSGELQNKTLIANLSQKQQGLANCEEKNTKLHEFGLALIKMYESPGLYQTILRKEPFTQIKRVELENIMQDYRDKIDEQMVTPK